MLEPMEKAEWLDWLSADLMDELLRQNQTSHQRLIFGHWTAARPGEAESALSRFPGKSPQAEQPDSGASSAPDFPAAPVQWSAPAPQSCQLRQGPHAQMPSPRHSQTLPVDKASTCGKAKPTR